MLRINASASAAGAKWYYRQGDYYAANPSDPESQELPGTWQGKGAAMLGLSGTITQADWDRLCDNRRPDTGKPLTARTRAERRVGYDMNFHVPKSVSLLYGLTRDERLLEAFRDSVRETMEEIEAETKARVRSGGRNEDRETGNLIWGEFVHFTARPEEDGTPDPHLHIHAFVLNATFDAQEPNRKKGGVEPAPGRWKAVELGDVKRDAPYFEAVFHAKLARRMEELGLPTVRTRAGWELDGIDRATIAKFSRRTARIERVAKEKGITDAKAKAALGATTRATKAKDLTMSQLEELWRSRLGTAESGSVDRLARGIGSKPLAEDREAAIAAVGRSLDHVFERSSVVPERELLAHALKQGVGKASRQTIDGVVGPQLLRGERNGRKLVTTREVLEEEHHVLEMAREGRGACRPMAPARTTFTREWLNPDQKAAVRHVLTSKDRILVVRGAAGAGKTTMLQEAREAIQTAGYRVFAFAPSTGASRGVLRDDGFAGADTVAVLLANKALQREIHGGDAVLFVDEAGLIGMKTTRRVFELAHEANARLVLVGDTKQHASVERGSVLRLLEEEVGLKPVELKEIQRQKGAYKAAVKALSEGRTKEGFVALDKLGWIHEIGGDDRNAALATAYIESVRAGKSTLVISPTHAEGDRITDEIRKQLRANGTIGKEARSFRQLVPMHSTLGEKRDVAHYQPGQVLVFHQNAPGFKKGQAVGIRLAPKTGRVTRAPVELAERFSVYRESQLDIAPGDRLRITKNGTSKDGHRLDNGDFFTVKGFTVAGDLLVFKDGRKQGCH